MIISQSPLSRQLQDYRLTTAEILYHMPDHPGLLQTYVWQELDLAPRYPVLRKFLDFWSRNLDGKLHSVRVANLDLISPGSLRHVDALMTLQ
ncbi:MAG: usg protein [Niveispirillum sp.]|uniref:usg protein n=1 Tax=Niveispirillum sp. TaxID=1917217 RepID=UPI003BA7CD91